MSIATLLIVAFLLQTIEGEPVDAFFHLLVHCLVASS
jgi:hypothetical protein